MADEIRGSDRCFGADLQGYAFAVGLSSFFATMLVTAGLSERHAWQTVREIGIAILILALALAWIARFQIRITTSELTFRSLFGGTRRIALSDIGKAQLKWDIGNGLQGPLRLIITPRTGLGQQRFSINAKVFSRDAISSVLEAARRSGEADDGELLDGVMMKAIRKRRGRGRRNEATRD